MKFDVIIATYNRRESLRTLVEQILECSLLPENIIIIDSSTDKNKDILDFDRVLYIHSNYGNQPYQRYVGYLASKQDILFYFDDDMRITDKDCFNKVLEYYNVGNVVAVQPNFDYKHKFLDQGVPKSKLRELSRKNLFFRFAKSVSGIPRIKEGGFWLAGLRGARPKDTGYMEYFNGPVFSVKRAVLYQNFNFNLFNLYQKKYGKAEDAILGFSVSKQGNIAFCEKKYFYHEDQNDSSYAVNIYTYNKRVAYSRLYLSFEYARLQKKSKFIAFLHFNVYSIGRMLSMLINQLICLETKRFQAFKGYLSGYLMALFDLHNINNVISASFWNDRSLVDIGNKEGS